MEIQFLSKVECQEKFDIEISYKTKFFTDWDKTGDGGPVLITLEMIYRDENGKKCKRYIGTYYPYIGFTKHSENKHELIIIDAVGNGDFSDEFKTGVTAFIKESNYKSFNGSSY